MVQAAELRDCDVYSYRTDTGDPDPFGEHGSIWAFNYFFYNKRLKRIVYFSCRSVSKATAADGDALSTPDPSLLTAGDVTENATDGGGDITDAAESSLPPGAADSDAGIMGEMDDID